MRKSHLAVPVGRTDSAEPGSARPPLFSLGTREKQSLPGAQILPGHVQPVSLFFPFNPQIKPYNSGPVIVNPSRREQDALLEYREIIFRLFVKESRTCKLSS